MMAYLCDVCSHPSKQIITWNQGVNDTVLNAFQVVSSLIPSVLFQEAGSDMTVIAFLIFPTRTNNFNVESLRGQAISKQLRETVEQVQKGIGHKLFEICLK